MIKIEGYKVSINGGWVIIDDPHEALDALIEQASEDMK